MVQPNLLIHGGSPMDRREKWKSFVSDSGGGGHTTYEGIDNSGIKTIREQVRMVASTKRHSNSSPHIIILEDAHLITTQAQSALRMIMEKWSNGTRFILCTDSLINIIEPLRSRCMTIWIPNGAWENTPPLTPIQIEWVKSDPDMLYRNAVPTASVIRWLVNECPELIIDLAHVDAMQYQSDERLIHHLLSSIWHQRT